MIASRICGTIRSWHDFVANSLPATGVAFVNAESGYAGYEGFEQHIVETDPVTPDGSSSESWMAGSYWFEVC